jgi:diacylglycerol kinase (ATP)
MSQRKFTDSVNFAIDGILHAFRTERNLKIHFALALIALIVSLGLNLGAVEILLIFGAITLVLVTEMINTALEEVINLMTISQHAKAKIAKDVAAGAVLLACINALVVAYLLIFRIFRKPFVFHNFFTIIKQHQTHVIMLTLIAIFFTILILKITGKRGKYTRGGIVSGHAALAFSTATAILFITNNVLATSLALLIALLVAQSRIEAKIHNWLEVLLGALVGIFFSLLFFQLFQKVI